MKFKSQLKEITNSKWFLYLMTTLAAINIIAYVMKGYTNTILFFLLVALLTFQFQKNIAIVLLVALVVSNLLMTSPMIREGLETLTEGNATDINDVKDKIKRKIKETKNNIEKQLQDEDKNENTTATTDNNKTAEEMKDETPSEEITDTNNPDMNKSTEDAKTLEGFDVKKGKKKLGEPEGFRVRKVEGTSDTTSKKSTDTHKFGARKFLKF